MRYAKKKGTILAIGDAVDFDSFRKFDKEKKFALSQGFDYLAVDYRKIFKIKQLDIRTQKVIVMAFFPFKYWNKHIECKNYRGMYGSLLFLRKFTKFCEKLTNRVEKLLPGKKIKFINDPRLTATYRDKITVMEKLRKAGVLVPARVKTKSVKTIKRLLAKGKKIYIKPRCGSMGKGISRLEHGKWQTNFTIRKNKVVKRYSDYGWKYRDVTGNVKVLRGLLAGDVIMEEAVSPFNVGKNKIDLRVYACFGKILYIYPRKNAADAVTTNISQGGKGSPALLSKIPDKVIDKVARQVRKTMRVLDLDFAGIDVIVDKDLKNTYVIDVNMFPGFPKRRTHNLACGIIQELK